MKKFAKILSILLCVAMLAGMIAVVATAEENVASETPAERDPSTVDYDVLPTPQVGYYDADGKLVDAVYHGGTIPDTFAAYRLVDGELSNMVFATEPTLTKEFWQNKQLIFLFNL